MNIEFNKIYNGDCYELIKGVADKSVDVVYTDVPYLYQMGGGGSSEVAKRIRANADRLADAEIDKGFDYSLLNELVRVMKKVNCFIWCSKLQIFDIANWFLNWANETGREIFYEVLVWCITNPTPACNNTWLPDVEYCLYFRETGVRLNDGYENKHKFFVSGLNVLDKDAYGHPTCKPLDFVRKNLAHVCPPGGVVLDPFLGSGTTCVAAKQLGFNYIGFEINKDFFKIASDRLEGWNQKGEFDLLSLCEL
jgi:DNA modification methylase